ncbi:low density lipoprotein receptor adapter protein 1-like isoform X2 [Melanerpes formicivorus]|uniref:low density lipoprotein receptor adapter protein 1-like isoform X2 n=1 Tax=Melanerpes formicivorus TaxID=211600 RepID=UPI00358EBD16
MEALRAAGRAVLRSPRLSRHSLGLRRRRKLPESWADMQEPLLEGMCFTLKYLGMTLVEKPKGEDMAAAAIRRIVATARVGARKFQKVILTVSPRGISLQDADTKEMVENISIYRISYCTTDKLQNKVFAYVAQSQESGALECHAFLSPKKKIAQAVTLTVAQAFQMALDLWEAAHTAQRSWGREPTAQQGQHLLCPEQALLLHSSCATVWDNPQIAGGGQEGLETSLQLASGLLALRLLWAKLNLGDNGPATQDSPYACPWARQRLPLALPARLGACWHRCHAVHRLQRLLLVLHEPLQLLPASISGWWTSAPCSAHSQCRQSSPSAPHAMPCALPRSPLLPCSLWWQLGTS